MQNYKDGDTQHKTKDKDLHPISNYGDSDTPARTLLQDPRSPGIVGQGLSRTPILVPANTKQPALTPLRGTIPPNFEVGHTPAEGSPHQPRLGRLLMTSTPTTLPTSSKDQALPSSLLAETLRRQALVNLLDLKQVSPVTAPTSGEAKHSKWLLPE